MKTQYTNWQHLSRWCKTAAAGKCRPRRSTTQTWPFSGRHTSSERHLLRGGEQRSSSSSSPAASPYLYLDSWWTSSPLDDLPPSKTYSFSNTFACMRYCPQLWDGRRRRRCESWSSSISQTRSRIPAICRGSRTSLSPGRARRPRSSICSSSPFSDCRRFGWFIY